MSPAELSIKRPIFISCIVILMLAMGFMSLKSLPIDLYPDVTFPTVVILTPYPGSGPVEIETEVSKVIEDEVSSISGINKISSTNKEGVSTVVAEFNLGFDIKYAEQQVRARVDNLRRVLPQDIDQPVIRTVSPSDAPILYVALKSDLPDGELYDLADQVIRPQFEQVPQVGDVAIVGGRKREIHVYLDRQKMKATEISATQVVTSLSNAGRNIPSGKTEGADTEKTYRTMADYPSIDSIKNTLVRSLFGSNATVLGSIGRVQDSLQDETSRTYVNGAKALTLLVYRQSGANTVKVADDVRSKVNKINATMKNQKGSPSLVIVNDTSRFIRANVDDVYESIGLGILLTVLVVYFFLGSIRSTLITGLALPNSLLGACILMSYFGFSINIMSLLALSLVVGLLVDDAIVVRENIYRKIEHGMNAMKAAIEGTNEVTLAVVATTFTILAVFGPIGNLKGIVGQFFKQFGLTICFAMAVSLFDALTVAPMLSAYFAGSSEKKAPRNLFTKANAAILKAFDRFQTWLENRYESLLVKGLKRPWTILVAGVVVFVLCMGVAKKVPVTFIPAQDRGEFTVGFDLLPGSSLDATDRTARKIDEILRAKNPQIDYSVVTVGNVTGEVNVGSVYVRLVERKKRKENTSQLKEIVRNQLKDFASANVKVGDIDQSGGGQRQFNLNITGLDLVAVKAFSDQILQRIKNHPALKDVDTSYRTGKPENKVVIFPAQAQVAAVSAPLVGAELRTQVAGSKSGIFREKGQDYDIRVRVEPDQRDLQSHFKDVFVPNVNNKPIQLSAIGKIETSEEPASILRLNRTRYVQLSADIAPKGPGLGGAMSDITRIMNEELKPPEGVSYGFVGEAERFAELMQNILLSMGLGLLFIYLVLASLYESFITPFTIMLVIPLAACGAFVSLYVTGSSFDLFSMIGCVMLMGLATKNSILMIDYTEHLMREGKGRFEALVEAGKTRLRPIMMTSFAMIAGMLPVAIGLNEASKNRTSLGIVVVGGTVSSTLLTLMIIPAAYIYVDRFQVWFYKIFNRIFRPELSKV